MKNYSFKFQLILFSGRTGFVFVPLPALYVPLPSFSFVSTRYRSSRPAAPWIYRCVLIDGRWWTPDELYLLTLHSFFVVHPSSFSFSWLYHHVVTLIVRLSLSLPPNTSFNYQQLINNLVDFYDDKWPLLKHAHLSTPRPVLHRSPTALLVRLAHGNGCAGNEGGTWSDGGRSAVPRQVAHKSKLDSFRFVVGSGRSLVPLFL